ncbi:MAG: HAMP domain-containing sensor histidine kinase [Ignavibacteriaceae bacterium]|nr:HAMP domain-containing sensor histidine kinase [Ignavibacteriaceae bacterium]
MIQKKTLIDKIELERKALEENKGLLYLIDNVQHLSLIINEDDDIIHVNKSFIQFFDFDINDSVIRCKFSDVIKCVSLDEVRTNYRFNEITSNSINQKIIAAFNHSKDEIKEICRVYIKGDKYFDSLITALPLNLKKHNLIMISMADISDIKWKETLEKFFFHDILNSAGALKECLNLLDGNNIEEDTELLSISKKISKNLIDEITSHRQFLMAERNEYVPDVTTFDCNEILNDISDKAKYSFLADDKNLKIFKRPEKIIISTDKTLLSRVIFNLVKNALEASRRNETVELYCIADDNKIEFIIKNVNVIPRNIQLQIFNKSFSTKGVGRGLGTYSAKFLTEKFLKGKVSFESSETSGTVFYAVYPLTIK